MIPIRNCLLTHSVLQASPGSHSTEDTRTPGHQDARTPGLASVRNEESVPEEAKTPLLWLTFTWLCSHYGLAPVHQKPAVLYSVFCPLQESLCVHRGVAGCCQQDYPQPGDSGESTCLVETGETSSHPQVRCGSLCMRREREEGSCKLFTYHRDSQQCVMANRGQKNPILNHVEMEVKTKVQFFVVYTSILNI